MALLDSVGALAASIIAGAAIAAGGSGLTVVE